MEVLKDLLDQLPLGSLILIAGNPGTGKTVFSASYVYRHVERGEKGAYVSFAESKEGFYRSMRSFGMDFKAFEEKGLFLFLDYATPTEPLMVEKTLEHIFKEVVKFNAEYLVVDSVSAIMQLLGAPKARSVFHVLFNRVVRVSKVTTIAIAEVPWGKEEIGLGVEEFLADAVIMLRFREIEARVARELQILKVRGVKVEHPRMIFTLHEGFRVIPPFKTTIPKEVRPFEPLPDSEACFTTGIKALDEAIGGFKKGGLVLLEVDRNVEFHQYHLLKMPLTCNFLLKGRGVLVLPSIGIDAEDIITTLKDGYGVSPDRLHDLLKVYELKTTGSKVGKPYVVYLKGDCSDDYERYVKIHEELKAKTQQPLLNLIGIDTLETLYGRERARRFLVSALIRNKGENGLVVAVAKPGMEGTTQRVANAADVHLKLVRRRGVVLLYGLKPRTNLYAIEADTSKGYLLPKLIPIM